jgi:hypothetical protein
MNCKLKELRLTGGGIELTHGKQAHGQLPGGGQPVGGQSLPGGAGVIGTSTGGGVGGGGFVGGGPFGGVPGPSQSGHSALQKSWLNGNTREFKNSPKYSNEIPQDWVGRLSWAFTDPFPWMHTTVFVGNG